MEPGGQNEPSEEAAPSEQREPSEQTEPEPLEWDEVLPPIEDKPEEGTTAESAPEEHSAKTIPGAVLESTPAPRWLEPEIAWPIAIFAGFLGSAIGAKSGVPTAGSFLAVALFTPLYLGLVFRQRPLLAALVSVGWLAAVGAGAAGSVLEGSFRDIAAASPGALGFRDAQILPWIQGEPAGSVGSSVLTTVGASLLILIVARISVGILSLVGLALLVSAIGAAVGWFAREAISLEPAWACVVGTPPHRALAFLGLLALTAALADRSPLLPLGEIGESRRKMILAGLGLLGVGLFSEPIFVSVWGSWLSEAAG